MKTKANSDRRAERRQATPGLAVHTYHPGWLRPCVPAPGPRRVLWWAAIALTSWPGSALADVGTPLVWGTAFHLLLGNALLGLGEGWLLARVFGLSAGRCARWLIAANYLSAWLGWALMGFLFERHATDIYLGLWVTWLLVGGTYLLTLLIEWPFVAACFRGISRWLLASIKGSVLVQTASYGLLIGWYWMLSGTSLYTGLDVVAADRIARPSGVVMFFISGADGHVYRADLSDSRQIKVADLDSRNPWDDHLELRENPSDTNYWDLVAVLGATDVVVWPRISSRQQVPADQAWRSRQYSGRGMPVLQIGSATNSQWHLGWANWPEVGMWARDGVRTVRVAYGLPFGGWSVWRVVHLPQDMALVQLGQQICLLDIPARQIALLNKGYGMLALLQEQILQPAGPPDGTEPLRQRDQLNEH